MVRSHRQPTSSDAHLTTDSRFFMEPLSRRSRKNSKGYVEMSDDSVVAGSDDPNDKKHFRLFGHSDNLDADEDEEGYQSEDDGLFVHDDDERYRLFDVMWGHRMERRYLDAAFRSGEVWVLDSDTYINNPEHPTPAHPCPALVPDGQSHQGRFQFIDMERISSGKHLTHNIIRWHARARLNNTSTGQREPVDLYTYICAPLQDDGSYEVVVRDSPRGLEYEFCIYLCLERFARDARVFSYKTWLRLEPHCWQCWVLNQRFCCCLLTEEHPGDDEMEQRELMDLF
jgi:hypothetical protein